MYLIEALKSELAKALSTATETEVSAEVFEYPELPENGDLAFPCFHLAKSLKQAPPKIAADLAEKIALPDGFARTEAKGPYLNFFLDHARVCDRAVAAVREAGASYGDRKAARPETVMVEYISPNTNKPLHLGHVRNGLIGEAVCNLLESQGHQAIRAMLLNDRGLAIAKAMVAYRKWGEGKTPESSGMKGDHFVAEWYVAFEKEFKIEIKELLKSEAETTDLSKPDPELVEAAEEKSTLAAEARETVRKWEEGDAATRELWNTMNAWCVAGQQETYKRFGFRFDAEYRESDIYKEGKAIVEEGVAKGAFAKEADGHVVAKLEAYGLPDKILLRSNGTALYITQDLYLAKRKFDDHDLDRSLYVVGNEQNLQFRQLFKILELAGYPWAQKLAHLSYGYVALPEGRMKSREGTVVDADDLLSSLEADAFQEIRQRHPTIPDDEANRRAHQVALAAVKFYFLDVDISTDMIYDPKASLAFTGKTGPYLQYMHARIRSLLRKAEETLPEGDGRDAKDEEFRLAFALARFPEAVRRAAEQSRPSLVAAHLYETAKAVAALYENAPILNASKEDREARLRLMEASAVVLKRGAHLLGFEMPEEM